MNFLRWSFRGLLTLLELFFDVVGILISFGLAHWLYTQKIFNPNMPSLIEKGPLILFVLSVLLILFYKNGLYRKHHTILNIEETRLILKSLLIAILITFTLFELGREVRQSHQMIEKTGLSQLHALIARHDFSNMFSRLELVLTFSIMFPLLSSLRYFLFKGKQILHLKGIGNERVLIYGEGDLANRLQKKISQSPKSGYSLIGTLRDSGSSDNTSTLGTIDDLEKLCQQHEINCLLVAHNQLSPDQMVEILQKAQALRLRLEFVPALHSLFVHQINLKDIDGLPLISIKNLKGSWWRRLQKRLFDLALSLFLLALSLPLFVIVGLWIKLSSPGPVFFKQKRVGLKGKSFTMYKFRTMILDSETYAPTPDSLKDQRLTACGRWLRRFSLDELPQLINVLKNDMSLVGPRPEMSFIVEKYTAQERERLRVKPGLTGLWQISADRKLQIHENLDYDLYYIEHQDLLLDVVILLRTFYSVIRGIGAW